jgi:hypothetical protein
MAAFAQFRATKFYKTSPNAGEICKFLPRIFAQSGSQKFPFNFNDYQGLTAAPRSMDAAWKGNRER